MDNMEDDEKLVQMVQDFIESDDYPSSPSSSSSSSAQCLQASDNHHQSYYFALRVCLPVFCAFSFPCLHMCSELNYCFFFVGVSGCAWKRNASWGWCPQECIEAHETQEGHREDHGLEEMFGEEAEDGWLPRFYLPHFLGHLLLLPRRWVSLSLSPQANSHRKVSLIWTS